MIPAPFQTHRALMRLNVGAVGLSLAAVTAAVFAGLFHDPGLTSVATGVPTLLVGTLWAWVVRLPNTVGNSSLRWGRVVAAPLAMLNASLAVGLLATFEPHPAQPGRFLYGALTGATFGCICWLPALLATLVCFGFPIAWAQRLAKKGLAGEERGEWIVGLICFGMSVLGLLISFGTQGSTWPEAPAGAVLTRAFALFGALAALTSTGLALAREARRRRFVADAEAGRVPGYRVDATDDGKILVHVVTQGKGYRVADFEEDVFELDAHGEATRPMVAREKPHPPTPLSLGDLESRMALFGPRERGGRAR